jgi:hypothetical protein
VLCCAVCGLFWLASRCAALTAAVGKWLAKEWRQGVGLGLVGLQVGLGCRLGTYSSCCPWVSCKVQDGCCGCGEEVAILCGEGVRAGGRLQLGLPGLAWAGLCAWVKEQEKIQHESDRGCCRVFGFVWVGDDDLACGVRGWVG